MCPETTGKKIGDVPLEQRFGVTVQFAAQYAGVSRRRPRRPGYCRSAHRRGAGPAGLIAPMRQGAEYQA